MFSSKSFILDVRFSPEYASGTVSYCHQKVPACIEFGNSQMKLVKYVTKKLKRMARNMFCLFPGIAVQKFP